MSLMGGLGDIVFEVSSERILTIDDFKRTSAARWADHERHLRKPISEFLGPGLDDASFTILFSSQLGVDVDEELNKILDYERKGKALTLVIGQKALGVYKWTIRSFEQEWKHFGNEGKLIHAAGTINLKEYAKR